MLQSMLSLTLSYATEPAAGIFSLFISISMPLPRLVRACVRVRIMATEHGTGSLLQKNRSFFMKTGIGIKNK